ncbi:protein SFI1 homolog isoform X3 [Tenrec ecaudatus]|uniref:protein SFI1 homolog isoform X3 n=1 Tax=Tenrec ecaudatus TaxID=94439 RepID=UPI003F59C20D
MKKAHSVRVQSSTKPSAFPGVRGRLPSALHPVHHHASYRRGRLKDLRVRCMTRKFLFLWIRKTFGRISPTKARCYYEQRVQRKVFEEWKEEWWISHREWKLCVRADCHYRCKAKNTPSLEVLGDLCGHAKDQTWDADGCLRTQAAEYPAGLVEQVEVAPRTGPHGPRPPHHSREAQSPEPPVAGVVQVARTVPVCPEGQAEGGLCSEVPPALAKAELPAGLACVRAAPQTEEAEERDGRPILPHHSAPDTLLRLAVGLAVEGELACAPGPRAGAGQEDGAAAGLRSLEALQAAVCRSSRPAQNGRGASPTPPAVCLLQSPQGQRGPGPAPADQEESCPPAAQSHGPHCSSGVSSGGHSTCRGDATSSCCRPGQMGISSREPCPQPSRLGGASADGTSRKGLGTPGQRVFTGTLSARSCYFRETLGRQVFAVWQQKTLQHRESRLVERVAILHAERQLLLRAWSTWHQQAAACHQERQRQAVACAHHRQWQLQRAFRVWRESAQGRRTEKLGKARAAEFHAVQLLRWAWNRWRECLALLNAERQKLVQADRHRQCTLLRRVWRGWVTYQDRGRQVLREVAAREGQHNRRLLRGMLQRWHENTVARVDEAQKARQAHHHYRRIICSKVLAQWREASAVQIYYRQQEDWTVQEARRMLDRGCVQIVFRRWQSRSQSVAQQRVQMERAAQHHRRRLLREAVARWKAYHLGCIRKALLRRQSAQLLVERLSRSCFRQWSRQLVAQREEQQGTAKALWFWSISLQAKVIGVQGLPVGRKAPGGGGWQGSALPSLEAWDAWQRFMLERKRKKARLERAAQAHQQQLLREGVTQLLQFAAGQKASRQQWHAQQQAQVAHGLHRAVRHCAMLWKQKALGPAKYPLTSKPTTPSRRVTFEVPLVSLISAGAGDAALETKRPRAKPEPSLDSLALAAGDSRLLELSAARPVRRQPRCPDFLLEPEQSRVLGCRPHQGPRPEKVPHPGVSQPASTSLPQPSQEEAWMAPAPCSSLPQPKTLPRPPGLKEPPTRMAGPKLVLLPPSSFMPRRGRTAAGVSVQPHSAPPLAGPPDPQLLLPGDFTGPQAWPELAPASAGSAPLQAELAGIRQQLQHYQSTKQNLCSCQRQANILRRWLELSREEPRPEDQEAEQQVQKELEEVEAQIQHLTATLRAQHQPIGTCIARVRALRQALS